MLPILPQGLQGVMGVPGAGTPPATPAPMPQAPMPTMPMPMQTPAAAPSNRGAALAKVLQQVMPAMLAVMAAKNGGPSAAGAMLQGITQAAARKRQEEQQVAEQAAQQAATEEERAFRRIQWDAGQKAKRDAFQVDALKTLADITDAGQYARTRELFEQAGADIFGLPPGWIAGRAPEPDATASARQKVDDLKKVYGDERFGYLLQTDAVVDGKPLSEWMALSRLGATDPATGRMALAPVSGAGAVPGTSDFSTYLRTVFQEFEDANQRPPSAAERKQLSLQARKEFGQVDDRPTDPMLHEIRNLNAHVLRNQLATGMTLQEQNRVETIANAFRSEPAVRRAQTVAEAVEFVNSLSDTSQSSADDQALVYAFAKAMDPESVVREGEYATVQKYAESWLQTQGFNAARILTNSEFLTPEARRRLKDTIRKRFNAGRTQYDNLRRQFSRQIERITGQPGGDQFLVDYGAAFPTAGPTPTSGQPSGQTFTITHAGQTFSFPSQQALDNFKKAAGIK